MKNTKDIFCAKCQEITPHTGTVDGNGEFVFSCTTPDCGRFVKFPAEMNKKDFTVLTGEHQAQNEGQISIEAQEKKLSEIMDEETLETAGEVEQEKTE